MKSRFQRTRVADPKGGLVLNYDILIDILSFLPPKGLFSLMRTCRTLYEAGIPLHVQGDTLLRGWKPLSSFAGFLLASPARIRHFKTLKLDSGYYDAELPRTSDKDYLLVGKFGQILSQAGSQLRTLELHDTEFFLAEPWGEDITPTISGLPNLERLVLEDVGPLGRDVLKLIQSPVSSLTVSFGCRRHSWNDARMVDPVGCIENLRETLTTLDITNGCFRRKDVQFPKVHTVQARGYHYYFDLAVPYHCFPNLRNLLLTGEARQTPDNLRIESTRARSHSNPRHIWTSLETFECEVNYAYLLGFKFQEPVQMWRTLSLKTRPLEIRRFHILLEDLQPIRLSTGNISDWEKGDVINNLKGLFPQSFITHLSFSMDLTHLPAKVAPAAVTDTYLLWVSKLELKFLQMHIEYDERKWTRSRSGTPNSKPLPHPLPPTPVGTYIKTWDLEAYVRRLAQVSPNLQHVFFIFGPPPALRLPSFWQITRENPGSDVQLRSLTMEEARVATESANLDTWKAPLQTWGKRGAPSRRGVMYRAS